MLAMRESYGYELSQWLEASGLGPVQGGTLYPVLLRLQRSGLVEADWREGGSGPVRKYYRISAAGLETLRLTTSDWHAFAHHVDAILREVPAR